MRTVVAHEGHGRHDCTNSQDVAAKIQRLR